MASGRNVRRGQVPSRLPGTLRGGPFSKLAISEEESDETPYWMELLVDAGIMPNERLHDLMDEGDQIVAMIVASIKASIKTLRSQQ